MDLYADNYKEFSNSRNSQWQGWVECMQFFESNKLYLDLGCGNGRFLKFLLANNLLPTKYFGLDKSRPLLNIARGINFNDSEFKYIDFNSTWEFNKQVDYIVAFGITHHLEKPFREYFFQNISNKLNQKGLAIVSFWDFYNYERFTKKLITSKDVLSKYNIQENDYIMTFGKENSLRFCHAYNQEEINNLVQLSNLKLVTEFFADGFNNKLNHYVVLQKV